MVWPLARSKMQELCGTALLPREPGWSPGLEQRALRRLPVRYQAQHPWGAPAPAPIPEHRLLEAAGATAKRPITALINTRLDIKINSPADVTFQCRAVPSSP